MHSLQNCKIVRASVGDLAELLEIWEESVLATHAFLLEADFRALRQEMAASYLPAAPELWIHTASGCKTGFMACAGSTVEMLFVRPRYFCMGIGSSLLRHAEAFHGRLKLSVNAQNEGALRFYERIGFVICGFSGLDGQGREYPLFHMARE